MGFLLLVLALPVHRAVAHSIFFDFASRNCRWEVVRRENMVSCLGEAKSFIVMHIRTRLCSIFFLSFFLHIQFSALFLKVERQKKRVRSEMGLEEATIARAKVDKNQRILIIPVFFSLLAWIQLIFALFTFLHFFFGLAAGAHKGDEKKSQCNRSFVLSRAPKGLLCGKRREEVEIGLMKETSRSRRVYSTCWLKFVLQWVIQFFFLSTTPPSVNHETQIYRRSSEWNEMQNIQYDWYMWWLIRVDIHENTARERSQSTHNLLFSDSGPSSTPIFFRTLTHLISAPLVPVREFLLSRFVAKKYVNFVRKTER